MNPLKIVIADDNKRMVDVIKEVINGEPQLDVVGTATNGEDTVDVIKKTQPDIVLLDIIMPQIDGLTVMQRIREDNDCVNPAFIVIRKLTFITLLRGDCLKHVLLDCGAHMHHCLFELHVCQLRARHRQVSPAA